MSDPDFEADPDAEPYRVLGIDPTGGPDAYRTKAEIKERAKALTAKHANDKRNYRAIQRAMKRAMEIHPERSSNGVWRVPLSIGVEQRTVTVGESVVVEVTDFCGEPLANARITTGDGLAVARTDDSGTASVSVSGSAGKRELVAAKRSTNTVEFVEDSVTITAEQRRHGLHIEGVPETTDRGDHELRVVDDAGEPVPGAEVGTTEGIDVETDADGTVTVALGGPGEVTITATKDDTPITTYGTDAVSVRVT